MSGEKAGIEVLDKVDGGYDESYAESKHSMHSLVTSLFTQGSQQGEMGPKAKSNPLKCRSTQTLS